MKNSARHIFLVAAIAGAVLHPSRGDAADVFADLGIAKSVTTPVPARTGEIIGYKLVVTNGGPTLGLNVTVTDATPAGTTFEEADPPSGWNCTTPPPGGTGTIQCSTPSFANGASAEIDLEFNVVDPTFAPIENTASVALGVGFDRNPDNNSSTVTTRVANPGIPTATAAGLAALAGLITLLAIGLLRR